MMLKKTNLFCENLSMFRLDVKSTLCERCSVKGGESSFAHNGCACGYFFLTINKTSVTMYICVRVKYSLR